MIAAGSLRHRVTLQEQVHTVGEYGEISLTWTDVAEVWADVHPLSVREFIASQAVQNQVSTRIVIRYRDDVTPDMRIAYKGKIYGIEGVLPDPFSGTEYLTLACSSGVNNG